MSDISVIGLGAMGSALARAFIEAGHDLTVWNRTSQKMQPLISAGAAGAETLQEAVQASAIIVICVDNYAITKTLFDDITIQHTLSGKILIQLSTGTPKEARESQNWFEKTGVTYIDGAIMPYPDGIGREDARILFAGPEEAYSQSSPYLKCLGGDLRYLGNNIVAAAALDMAWLTYELCNYLAALHGANLCESEGVSVESLASMFPEGFLARRLASVVHSGNFANPGATLTVWEAALQSVQTQANDAQINCDIPDFVSSLFNRAIAAGYGEDDVAAVIKVLREDSPG